MAYLKEKSNTSGDSTSSGKTIIPFVTHGGSGFSDTINTIRDLEPKAEIVNEGLSIFRNSVANAQADVKECGD